MYSTTIKPKVDGMFDELRKKVERIVSESATSNEAIATVTKRVSSELARSSKSILSDMLFHLSDSLMKTEFFSDISRQNKFFEADLRGEILGKCEFTPNTTINYKEASREIRALKVGGATLAVGGAVEVGVILIKGLPLPSLVPIPIGVLIAASIGAAVADYYAVEPARNKKELAKVLDNYLVQTKRQFLEWFDEVECFFDKRVEEIKRDM